MATSSDISVGDGSTAAGIGGGSMFGDYGAASATRPDDATVAALEALQLSQTAAAEQQGITWEFDFNAGTFVRRGQSVAMVDGNDSLAQWCQHALATYQYSALVAPDDFGISIEDVIKGDVHPNAVVATINQRISEALEHHPLIKSISDFEVLSNANGVMQVSYTINTTAGSTVPATGSIS